ncbi:hypothetical protein H0A66_08375 [Alcaligenaceae bacterium]|nr:hypothetical protein [Alcaligenaceae bacterium]
MKKSLSATERAVQIELLRARAAIERHSLTNSLGNLGQSLKPGAVMHAVFPRLSSKSATGWLLQVFKLTRQYPLLASSASALLTGVGKRKRLWKIAAGLLLSWQLAQVMKDKGSRRSD